VYERCFLCHGILNFHGISVKPIWTRWLECQRDLVFFGCDEFGNLVAQGKRIPENAYFVQFREGKNA